MTDRRTNAVRSYSTHFPRDEDPISEGGMWVNGKADGIDWTDVITGNGVAYGAVSRMSVAERRAEQANVQPSMTEVAAPEGDYDDPTAVLTGAWGTNQYANAEVFIRNPTEEYFQEVQIRFRHTMQPHSCTGYEVIYRCLATENSYVEIVRWNGKVGGWTSLARREGAECGIKDGDRVQADVTGNVVTAFIDGEKILSVADDTFGSGSPGIGFNFGVGNTNVDHGFSSFEVDTYDD